MTIGGVALCSGATERNARTMGMVLSFVPRTAATNRAVRNTGTPAAVIIFPGVRYEQRPLTGEARPGVDPDKPGSSATMPSSSGTLPVPHH
ncbi:hypothetical protein CN311_12780 [Mesorhizobium sanjuanii]|uniref:Uncharacterized protein n=2 Tax=Mesorhizobium sanjuanii TaxID=2037900 RepID=A0A2A6FFT2_9HYPH|nr:hypothetical protein CN311_12780 [Mesorhizobium sanjuanii]